MGEWENGRRGEGEKGMILKLESRNWKLENGK
jgi:hypothetical protein